ncbi:MAG: ABC transporter substrate-binding protein, partial [Candidatus Aminicenantia bacterium]
MMEKFIKSTIFPNLTNGLWLRGKSFIFLISLLTNLSNPQDTLIESFRSFPVTLNPLLATDEVSISIADKVFSGLFTIDRYGNVVTDLVKQFKEEENYLIIALKENLFWHDGRRVTTNDLIFTFNLMRDRNFQYPYINDLDFIKEIVPIDSKRAKIIMNKKFAPYLLYLTFKILPSHMKEESRRPDRFLPGTGPFKFYEVKFNQFLLLKRNEKYFRGTPEIKFYKLVVNPDPLINPLKLIKGEIHIGEIEHEIYRSMKGRKDFNSNVSVIPFKKNSYTYLAFNIRNPSLKKEMRKAIAHSIPRKKMVENLLMGMGEVSDSHIILKKWKINGLDYEYNPEISIKIIKDLGWRKEKKYFEKDGKNLEFTLVTNGESILRRRCATIIENELEKIGIKVEIKLYEYLSFRNALKKGDFDLAISGYLMDLDPNVWDLFSSRGILNYSGFSNPHVDDLLLKGREIID